MSVNTDISLESSPNWYLTVMCTCIAEWGQVHAVLEMGAVMFTPHPVFSDSPFFLFPFQSQKFML